MDLLIVPVKRIAPHLLDKNPKVTLLLELAHRHEARTDVLMLSFFDSSFLSNSLSLKAKQSIVSTGCPGASAKGA